MSESSRATPTAVAAAVAVAPAAAAAVAERSSSVGRLPKTESEGMSMPSSLLPSGSELFVAASHKIPCKQNEARRDFTQVYTRDEETRNNRWAPVVD